MLIASTSSPVVCENLQGVTSDEKNLKGAMKATVLFLAVLGCAFASPNGYYHQEYNYKTSSSSYKNNELQHQTDDQGYYVKNGDLEGRVRPRVDSNSEHSEYVNPNLRNTDYSTGVVGGANGDLSSYGHMRANVGAYNSRDHSAEGLAHSDHIAGNRGYSGYSSGSYGASYGGSQAYNVASNLRTMTSGIQEQLERDLQQAIEENRAYSTNQLEFSELERELKQNLSNRINNELTNRYGQQSIRGGLSYTLSGGRLHSTANYDNQELLDLRRQLENNLLANLRTQYNQAYGSSNRYVYATTARPVYTTTLRPVYTSTSRPIYYTPIRPSYPDSQTNYVQYTPVPNPESITTIASRVQNQLDSRLNQMLEDIQRTYFSSSSSYSLMNSETLLERLRNELRNNVTSFLDEEISKNYGTQVQRDGHMFTVGAGGATASQYNYATRDLENLRSQIERNLIEKLNRDFERYKTSWHQRYSQSSQSSHSSSYGQYSSTPRYDVYSTPRYVSYNTPRYETYTTPQYNLYDADVEPLSNRPTSNHLTSLITGSGASSSHSSNNQYLVAGAGQSGYQTSGVKGGSSVSQLQRQLQQDLSRQLQAALSRGYGYYSSGAYNPQSYKVSLQQLSDELNRNLTRQLQEYTSSGYYSTYGNVDQSQLANLQNQLQADLMRQLQQGLQQSYHTSSSYSASSSSSSSSGNYRPVRGYENYQYGQYNSGANVGLTQGEDCVGDDPNAYVSHRMKRSYQPYRSQPIGLSSTGYNSRYNPYRSRPQEQEQLGLGQQEDNSDLTQQVEDVNYGKLQLGSQNQQQIGQGQEEDDSDLTQQVEDVNYGKLQADSLGQQQISHGQQEDNSDLTQQVEDLGYGKLQLGSQSQQQITRGQQEDNSDLTQQVEDVGYGKLQLGSQSQQQFGHRQQEDTSDLTQQVEDVGYGKLQLGSQNQQQIGQGQEEDDSDLTQQVEDVNYGKLQVGSLGQQQISQGQQEDNSDLTQQVEDVGYGKLQLGSQSQQQITHGQQEDNSDLTQQVEDVGYGKLQLGSQSQQQIGHGQQEDNSDLTQQVEDVGYGKLQLGSQSQQQFSHRQQEDNSDLTQQVEDVGYGKLQLGSQNQQQIPRGQEDNSHLTQQVAGAGYGKLQLGSQYNQQIGQGQEEDDSDLTQQVEDAGYGKLQLASQDHQLINQGQLTENPQQVESGDLTQQVEDTRYGQFQLSSQQRQQQSEYNNENLQSSSQGRYRPGKLQLGSHQEINYGQQEDNSDLTQQEEDASFGGVEVGSQRRSQQTERSTAYPGQGPQSGIRQDLSQQPQRYVPSANLGQQSRQVGDVDFNWHRTSHQKPQEQYNTELTQQVENSDLTQQTEDDEFGLNNQNLNTLDDSRSTSENLEPNQVRFVEQLERDLSSQLDSALKTASDSTSSTNLSKLQRDRLIYQVLVDDIQKNITDQLESIRRGEGRSGYFSYTYYSFSNQQLFNLKKKIENDLKLQLQQKVSQLDDQQNQFARGDQYIGNQQFDGNGLENSDLTQQREVNSYQLETGQQDVDQTQQVSQNSQFNQNPTRQVDNYYPQQIPSANLQRRERPRIQRPIDSNKFIQTEIDQQQQLHSDSGVFNQHQTNLPTSSQITEQNQERVNEEYNAEIPSRVEPLNVADLTQQTTGDRQEETSFADDQQTLESESTPQQPGGQAIRITDQGQIVAQQQSLADAEREADLLIQKLRDHQQNRPTTPVGEHGYVHHNRPVPQEINDPYRHPRPYVPDSSGYMYGSHDGYSGSHHGYRSSHHGYRDNYHQQFHYGHSGQVEQHFEETSTLRPTEYGLANVVENVEPNSVNPNIGVKGHRSRPYSAGPPPPNQLGPVPPPPNQVGAVPPPVIPPQPGNIPVEEPVPQVPSEPAGVPPEPSPETPGQDLSGNVPDENLPWWKRFGNKIKSGATSLKEKYIG